MFEDALHDVRQQAISLLEGRANGVRIRSASEFSHIDDAVFYAERQNRAFNICVINDVEWDASVSSYEEEADSLRSKSVLMVDVANSLDGNEEKIVELYESWFDDR